MRSLFCAAFVCLILSLAGSLSPAKGQGESPIAGGSLPPAAAYYDRALVAPPEGSDFAHANTFAGDALENMMRGRVNKTAGILTATMVNLDNLDETSSFGRLVMQQISSRLGQYGYRVMDVRLRAQMVVNPAGEFMLSRDIGKLMQSNYGAEAVLVGTYTVTSGRVYCSARLLRLSDSAVVAAYEYYLPRKGEVARLLNGRGNGSLGYALRQPAFPTPAPLPPVQRN